MLEKDRNKMAEDLRQAADCLDKGDIDKVILIIDEQENHEKSSLTVLMSGFDKFSAVGILQVISQKLAA